MLHKSFYHLTWRAVDEEDGEHDVGGQRDHVGGLAQAFQSLPVARLIHATQGSRKKSYFLVTRPLRGGKEGLATKKKITFFEAIQKKYGH